MAVFFELQKQRIFKNWKANKYQIYETIDWKDMIIDSRCKIDTEINFDN